MPRAAALLLLPWLLLALLTGNWARTGETAYLAWIVAGHAVGIPLFVIGAYLAGRFGTFTGFTRRQWLAAAPLVYLVGFALGLYLLPLR
jgi:hypothetical protein